MSVLLMGMEMPTEGQIVLVEIDENGDVFAAYDGGRTKLTQHKAVPVPPHGRLIDADANLAVMMRVLDAPYTGHGTIDTAMLKACIKMFEESPTIIEAEEAKP